MKTNKKQVQRPAQKQNPPGLQNKMKPLPVDEKINLKGSEKLKGQVAIITGADSGIGRAVAIDFAKEGAEIVIVYLKEHSDAKETKALIKNYGKDALLISADVGDEKICKEIIKKTISHFGKIDILVNNAAEQHPKESIEEITEKQLEKTFRTNIFSYFFMTKAALKHLKKTKGKIINTTSVTAFRGSEHLLDYSATKGAIVAFTRSLSLGLIEHGIRVNAVAPGPVWTPLIASTFSSKKIKTFGSDVPMKRAGQPAEIATCFSFLASDESSYISGQTIHPNGGEVINA